MKLKVTYFFRKPYQDYHSIEGVFNNLQDYLHTQVIVKNHQLKRYSSGIINRILSCFEVSKHQGDVNHITGDIHFVALGLQKEKTILTIHDLAPLRNSSGIKHALLKYFWYQLPSKHVKYITVISEFTKCEFLNQIEFDADRIKVIGNPLNEYLHYSPKLLMDKKPRLLQVGTAYNKNLEGLIIAITGLNVTLTIIGNLSKDQLALLKDSKINYENFKNLEYSDVIKCYENADIVCFATLYEGFGLPILEAQKIGRPVITSTLAAMPETAGKGAILIDPLNIEQYRTSILELINNQELRKELISLGLDNTKRFDGSRIAEQYLNLYKTVYAEQ